MKKMDVNSKSANKYSALSFNLTACCINWMSPTILAQVILNCPVLLIFPFNVFSMFYHHILRIFGHLGHIFPICLVFSSSNKLVDAIFISSTNLSGCKSCIAVASKRFPLRQRLYDFLLRNLLMEPLAMTFVSKKW